ncbi:MAG: M48 family metallopeptidase [Candidatus Omnitrophica bacterium]|nr:M48 family metallopeptidase [Candidatus Omnitrophota bacterium]
MSSPLKAQNRSKVYSNFKYALAIIDIIYLVVLLIAFLGSGLSSRLAVWINSASTSRFLTVPLYILAASALYYILSFPLNYCRSYQLEHKFALSTQKLNDWFFDQLKGGLISYVISLILAGAFYFILDKFSGIWWLVISIFWIIFSLVLAKLTPILIIPLFFKYKKLDDEVLRERILKLADKMKVKILDVFEIDFSKKTLKANAAFVGVGKTRRVLLADTLKNKYTHDEIEVILAHEFAHYKLKHLIKLLLVNSVVIIAAFYLIFISSTAALKIFNLSGLSDIAALPLVVLYFVLFGVITQPVEAFFSRVMEKEADKLALKITGLKAAFISTMDKLGEQNLADRKPHPLIKFYFFDHPPIDERIDMVKEEKI